MLKTSRIFGGPVQIPGNKKFLDAWKMFGSLMTLHLVQMMIEFSKEEFSASKVDPISQFAKPIASHMNKDHGDDTKLLVQHSTSIPFSLPLPQSERNAITRNPVLREDQLPQRFGVFVRNDQFGRSRSKKNASIKGEDFFVADDIFSGRADRKEALKPPVRQAITMFSGKRNPNDNHYSRAKH